jgi:hypothetical protein
MKKIFFYSVLILVCFSFFSGQNSYKKDFESDNNQSPKLSGWSMMLAPDTEHFAKVFFSNENLGCIYKGYHPVKRTTDGGVTWGYGITPYFFTSIDGSVFFNGNQIFMSGHNFFSSIPIYITIMLKSSDMGLNWDTARSYGTTGIQPYYLFCSMDKNIGYVNFVGNWAGAEKMKTNNGGYDWYLLPYTIPSGCFAFPNSISYYDTNVIYGINPNGGNIGRSVTGSSSNGYFSIIKTGYYTKICLADSNSVFALSGNNLYKSTNSAASWEVLNFPVNLNSIKFPNQLTGYISGANGKIYKTTNKGLTWGTQITSSTDSLVDCYFLNAQTGYVIGYGGTLLKTNDGGGPITMFTVSGLVKYSDNNQPVTSGYVKAFKLDRNTGNIITFDSTQILPDGSYTFTNIPRDSLDIGVYPNTTPPNDYVITYYPSTVYWQQAVTLYPTGNLTNINIGAIRMSPSTNSNSVNGKVMRVTLSPYVGNLKDAILYAKNGNTFVRCSVSDGNGVYHLNSLPAGSIKIRVDRIGFHGDSTTVNVTTISNTDSVNFYLTSLIVTGIKKTENTTPSEYKLYQNYPNPFNPSTNIKYQIKNNKLVTLKIYNILGIEVATLVSEKQSPGVYEVTFDGSGFASGIYFYKLIAGDYSETRRMILIK